jgi:hypothetical protein
MNIVLAGYAKTPEGLPVHNVKAMRALTCGSRAD